MIYTSSFFGDELWPSDKLGFTRSALANAPSPVSISLLFKLPRLRRVQHALSPGHLHSALARQTAGCKLLAWHMGAAQSPAGT